MLALVHLCATWALVGLTWVVQLVVYPGFRHVPAEGFKTFHGAENRTIGPLVVPLMFTELGTALALAWTAPSPPTLAGAALVLVVWGSTFALQVPLHAQLARGKDDVLIDRLVRTHTIRTVAWTARGVIAALLV